MVRLPGAVEVVVVGVATGPGLLPVTAGAAATAAAGRPPGAAAAEATAAAQPDLPAEVRPPGAALPALPADHQQGKSMGPHVAAHPEVSPDLPCVIDPPVLCPCSKRTSHIVVV